MISYANDRAQLMLIALLKGHGIKYVVASPGGTNLSLVASLQSDPWFEMFSCVDERSAAYLACGIAESTNQPVVLSCTGATASRNYMPGLTEAYYRKLPILAVTSTQEWGNIGQGIPQAIDRSVLPRDIAMESVHIPVINSSNDEWACNVRINRALIALKRNGGGPVHINLSSTWNEDFSVKNLPNERIIHHYEFDDVLPVLNEKKVAVFIGSHKVIGKSLQSAMERFCEKNNAVVFVDHTSNYFGKYRINPSILFQDNYSSDNIHMDLLIHIGDISGAYYTFRPKKVWRVNRDGEIRDYSRKLDSVFQMDEKHFFDYYSQNDLDTIDSMYYEECASEINSLYEKLDEIPFSNLWVASKTFDLLPEKSELHLAILNTLRTWNYFGINRNIPCYSNTGGFGIDGGVSSAVGSSLISNDKIVFCVVGDLAFFYDLNSIGNRHINSNLRILLINNGCGTEFKNYWTAGNELGDYTDKMIAAAGHFGNKSKSLVRHYAEDLGFEYLCAETKEEYNQFVEYFAQDIKHEKPIVFEIFTNSKDESDALYKIKNIISEPSKKTPKELVVDLVGTKNINKMLKIKRILEE